RGAHQPNALGARSRHPDDAASRLAGDATRYSDGRLVGGEPRDVRRARARSRAATDAPRGSPGGYDRCGAAAFRGGAEGVDRGWEDGGSGGAVGEPADGRPDEDPGYRGGGD